LRLVVFGAGAIGGAVGARLHQAGFDVTLIARGEHARVVRERGLTLRSADGMDTLPIPVVEAPDQLEWTGEEVVLLCVKSQDTAAALQSLRSAAPPVVCLQNGVENERLAQRWVEHVYGAAVMLPAAHLEPGVVEAKGSPMTGIVDIGRYPVGVDERAVAIAGALSAARFASQPCEDVMRPKYAKLLMNLANAPLALFPPGPARDEVIELARAEGRAALAAAGIGFDEEWPGPRELEIGGRRSGSGNSTWQSLARGAGGVETDYLNGEVVLLGRLHSVPVPVNQALCAAAARAVREGRAPETLSAEEVLPAWSR
jgi:2-dehydropantoate 2-reductase